MGKSKYFVHENDVQWRDFSGVPGIYNVDRGRFKLLVDENTKDLYYGVYELDPGEQHALHHHTDVAEFYYVMEGKATIRVNDEEKEVGPGTGIYMPVDAKHSIRNTGDEVLRVFWGYDRPRGYGSYVWDVPELQAIWEKIEPTGSKIVGQK